MCLEQGGSNVGIRKFITSLHIRDAKVSINN